MLQKIIRFSITNKLIIVFLTVVLIGSGIYSVKKLPIDAVPDITNNQVQVITLAPTLGAQEVERFITAPIELALANIPDIVERRSISRSGLSVITIVFHDKTSIYWARQQISERLKEAEQNIPQGLAQPELAPVTTGLGEIYHYVVYAKPGYETKYSTSDLRTIQDWIIKPQLTNVPGIAEISAWGGYVKTYEVALNNYRLKAMNVSIPEVFDALEHNNENTGGSYIEQKDNLYFIRGIGQVKSLDDIGKIMIKNDNGIPVLIRDVATVQYGSATRFGAVTRDGQGEVVGGVVLMLKGENFNEVSGNVKARMEQIRKSLPEGVAVEPYIDRSALVNRAIGTVEKNLLEGALIVIFILVLFLGNLRAGFIVASVIPLSMLFAIVMMKLFGVSGNLMSLGAIDFGLIVDGAVIIVEAILHRVTNIKIEKEHHPGLHTEKYSQKLMLSKEQMGNEVYHAASRMMNSATFGQIIILIVYIPILSLIGIEGKMFRPMAMTVAFAIIGALILSLTYIPMMSALFLPRKTVHKKNISDRVMDVFQKWYYPFIRFAINRKALVIIISVILFAGSILLYSRMGSEFIPTLEEGDLTVEIFLPQGTSLTKTIETYSMAEKILKEKFPEIKHAVTRIGSGEIPTDPMPIEQADIMLAMRPRDEWTSAHSREEMQEKIEEALSVIPGLFIEVTQPMQMRFNELMTGIKQDVAVKIFGDNMNTLQEKANDVAKIIKNVEGASEPSIERVNGLPQLVVEYDRNRLAQYGLSVNDVNRIINTAYAGSSAGIVYEGEKRFQLVVRLEPESRTNIDDIRNLFIPLNNGSKIELRQLADVQLREAPAQISREDGMERIYVGFNVRGRDVKSVVDEIQDKLEKNVRLPPGFYFTYGGTFQNLVEANKRLTIAVPLALLLIFFLLFLTFSSAREALLIYTAIPMSAIGGVAALWLRDMHFSISAGIGFIALFGVAVLNGIVLISTFNQLEKEGINDIKERVLKGTRIRLRPVLITAAVASLGFLPMAISTSAGAEVQKPLATVVIGGLVTATLLTLVVLPALYIIFSKKPKINPKSVTTLVFLIGLLIGELSVQGQATKRIPVNAAIDTAFKNNLQYQINRSQITRSILSKKTAYEIPKTGVFAENEDIRPSDRQGILKIGLSQNIDWPGLYKARKNYFNEQAKYYETNSTVIDVALKRDIRNVYYQLWYLQEKQKLFQQLDSIYSSMYSAARLQVRVGEVAGLDSIAAEAKMKELQAMSQQLGKEIQIQQQAMMQLLNTNEILLPLNSSLEKLPLPPILIDSLHPELALQQQNISIAKANVVVQQNTNKPEFSGRFFTQRLYGVKDPYSGFSATAAFPLFGAPAYKNKVKAAQADVMVQEKQLEYQALLFNTQRQQALSEIGKNETLLRYYESTGLHQAEEIIKAATIAYRAGEIGFADLNLFLTQAIDIRKNYLDNLNEYNKAIIQYNYLINQ